MIVILHFGHGLHEHLINVRVCVSDVRTLFTECSLNVHGILTECYLDVP
jgi:hypothetical protein